jgi:hypothetical protein
MPYAQGNSNFYLSGPNGANLFYFDVDPTPVPVPEPKMYGAVKRTIPTRNNATSALASGTTVVYNTGADLSSWVLKIKVPYMTPATYIQLLALFQTADQAVYYSPDNGLTVYQCAWTPAGLGISKPEGWPFYSGTLSLQVLAQTVGSGGTGGPGGNT